MHQLDQDLFWKPEALKIIHTQSPMMQHVLEKLKLVAPTRTTVLLLGDTGVGKGKIAKLIHQHSSRSDKPFVHLHCGAIPETLVESELFGYEKGAFTGASKRKLGRLDKAQGGTLFLDEINTISSSTQIKFLQVLQDRIFQRVGGEQQIETDVRIITASNANLIILCEEGSFRKDLYYRLSVFPIQLPTLQQRQEDIPGIVESLIEFFNQNYFKGIHGIDPEVLRALQQYSWPGNVRELENIIERAYILEKSQYLSAENFPQEILVNFGHTAEVLLDAKLPLAEVRKQTIEQVELQYLKELLTLQHGRINKAAEMAGITTRYLHKLLTKYGIHKESFKPIRKKSSINPQGTH